MESVNYRRMCHVWKLRDKLAQAKADKRKDTIFEWLGAAIVTTFILGPWFVWLFQ